MSHQKIKNESKNSISIEEQYKKKEDLYEKIISEINFVKIYLQFLKIIGFLYNKVQNYDLSYFYSIVESKFKLDYMNQIVNPQFSFLNEIDGEMKRINNLTLIFLNCSLNILIDFSNKIKSLFSIVVFCFCLY
jgi:hypothetical protein